ncbi:FtsX-like permease family protein [Lachnospiraceae bacterium MD1]|uniref:Putative hemin transport system permease protein HrtB n=1 Tax=Variimorphobacter saccharofermentans TaxID=2755051 RepID=A0A839JZ88_9FIRM|nr:FtsX-like permease family protein [Variimorphobacter saccharofermentans]MBB2182674.1 FtsX-like permease family protein [Variimorphobacter saccharofermentans]
MKQKSLSVHRLAWLNIRRKTLRSGCLMIIVAVLSFVMFGGTILSLSLENGLKSMKSRLGADLIVVPLEYDKGMEAILLKGEPSCFYFKRSVQEKITHLDGISQITSQFFLTSLSAECCDLPIQLIAFDPETDFTVQPWITQVYDEEISEGAVIIGSDINVDNNSYIKFYGENYKIAAKMEKTGTGLDQTVFTNMKTMEKLFEGAKKAGLNFLEDISPEYSISSVLIKAEDGYDRKTLIKDIRRELGGVQIIETQNMITNIASNLESFAVVIKIFAALFFGIAFITLLLMFSIIANERKKEFAVFRTLGATRGRLTSTLLLESLYISSTGGIIGILSAVIIVLSFHVYISERLGLPYLQPETYVVALVLIVTFLVVSSIGPLASVYSAVKISRQETYLTLREGE